MISGVMIVNLFMVSIVSMAANPQDLDLIRHEFFQDYARLENVSQGRDLAHLKKLSAELESKWFTKNREYYGYIILQICGNFRSWDFNDEEQFELEKRYARLALERSYTLQENDKIPMEVEFKLLSHIQQSVQYLKHAVKSEDWVNQRSTQAKLYFHAWHRLEKKIDPNWDPNEPSMSWPRPSGYDGIWFSGMSPESIKDPHIRTVYRADLEEFWRKQKRYTEQRHLRRLQKEYLPILQKHLLRLYSSPLFDSKTLQTEALQQDLEKYVKDKGVREIIFDGIRKKLFEESKPRTQEKLGN